MRVNIQRLLNIAMVLLSWSTIPFLGLQNIKRFSPVALLIGIIEVSSAIVGKKRKWWVFYNKPNSYLFGELPFNIGPFFTVSIWIMKLTFGNFKRFILINAIANAFFAYPLSFFANKIRYYKLVRFNHHQFFLYFFSKAFLYYWLQYLFEKYKSPKANNERKF